MELRKIKDLLKFLQKNKVIHYKSEAFEVTFSQDFAADALLEEDDLTETYKQVKAAKKSNEPFIVDEAEEDLVLNDRDIHDSMKSLM